VSIERKDGEESSVGDGREKLSKSAKEAAERAEERRRSSVSVLGYQGAWKDGKKHGIGKFTYPDGGKYEGEWQDDKAEGQGVFVSDISVYDGAWMTDLKHGRGKEEFNDGTTYEGDFNQGHRHGHGVLRWPDGSQYAGQFHCNNQEGHGVLTWKNNHKYTGQVLDNLIHGHGRYEWPDGTAYEGQYKMGLKDGEGIFIGKSSHEMKCMWHDGRPVGRVTFRQTRMTKDIVPPILDWFEGVMVTWAARSEEGTPRSKEGGKGGRADFLNSARSSMFATPRSQSKTSSRGGH